MAARAVKMRLTGSQSYCGWCQYSSGITLCHVYLLHIDELKRKRRLLLEMMTETCISITLCQRPGLALLINISIKSWSLSCLTVEHSKLQAKGKKQHEPIFRAAILDEIVQKQSIVQSTLEFRAALSPGCAPFVLKIKKSSFCNEVRRKNGTKPKSRNVLQQTTMNQNTVRVQHLSRGGRKRGRAEWDSLVTMVTVSCRCLTTGDTEPLFRIWGYSQSVKKNLEVKANKARFHVR